MPRVPARTGRSVADAPANTPLQRIGGATPDAFGADTGQALQGLGETGLQATNTALQIATNIEAKENERRAKELDNEFRSRRRDILYGDGTSPGFFSLNGRDSVDAAPLVREQLQKLKTEVSAKANRQQVQRMFDSAADQDLQTEFDNIAKQVVKHEAVAQIAVSETRISEATQDSAANPLDLLRVGQSKAIIQSEIENLARVEGWEDDVKLSKLEEAFTNLHKQRILNLLSRGQTTLAKEVFEDNKGDIDGPVQTQIEELFQTATVLGEAQSAADKIFNDVDDPDAQLAAAREIQDPTTRQETVKLVRQRQNDEARAQGRAIKGAARAAFDFLSQGGSLNQWGIQNPELNALLTTDLASMTNLRAAEDAFAEDRLFARTTDGETFKDFQGLSEKEKAEVDLEVMRSRLTRQEYSRAINTQEAAQNAQQEMLTGSRSANRGEEHLIDRAPDLMTRPDKPGSERILLRNRLRSEVQEFITTFQKQHGTDPSEEQIIQEVDKIVAAARLEVNPPGTAIGRFFRDNVGGPQPSAVDITIPIPPAIQNDFRVDLDEVDPVIVEDARETFREFGIVPTRDQLEQFLGAELFDDAERQRRLLGLE